MSKSYIINLINYIYLYSLLYKIFTRRWFYYYFEMILMMTAFAKRDIILLLSPGLKQLRLLSNGLAHPSSYLLGNNIRIPHFRCFRNKTDDLKSLFHPVEFKRATASDMNIGEELTGKLNKEEVLRLLSLFYKKPIIKELSEENGLDTRMFHQAYMSFRQYCLNSENLAVDLHIIINDVLQGAGHMDDIFPYFLQHARQVFPHLDCLEDLKKISDLRVPANWYPEARAIERKFYFHAGPTNSGKTYQALERFLQAQTGVYCGPLKLLAAEVYLKSNERGVPCDLITGEEKKYAKPDVNSNHVACTVEMTNLKTPFEVAIIDEIQMIRDPGRGWAWTRALLGVCAEEVHLCGEAAAISLVKDLLLPIGETVVVEHYSRLTPLTILNEPLGSLDSIKPGDCIVGFNKNDIYTLSRQIEKRGHECAVIYGSLPPNTKLAMAKKFNDPEDPCKMMVATDAIGMGLNLSIKRIIFYSLIKPVMTEQGEKELVTLSTSQALQIAGRAGRFGTHFSEGEVTTFKAEDLPTLRTILEQPIETIESAGLHPTADQIEMFAYQLPKATLSNLIDIFVSLCQMDNNKFFMCNVDSFKFLADMIQHIPLSLRVRYVFCCAPINQKMPFVCTMFLKFARQYSRGEAVTPDWLCNQLDWPLAAPETIGDLVHLENVFDVLDLFLWLSYRFLDMFPDCVMVRNMQKALDTIIQDGLKNITKLVQASEVVSVDNEEEAFRKPFSGRKQSITHQLLSHQKEEFEKNGETNRLYGKGRLSEKLIKQGLLTPRMLQQLQQELGDKKYKDVPIAKNSKNTRSFKSSRKRK